MLQIFVASMAILTSKFLGLAIIARGEPAPFWRTTFAYMPATMIAALTIPPLLDAGAEETLAGSIALGVAMLSRNMLVTILIGVATIAVLRLY